MVKKYFAEYENCKVVLDTSTSLIYAGEFFSADEFFITLKNADMQDSHDTAVSKAQYIMEIKRDGIIPNRKEVKIKQSAVVSISKVEDIVLF